MKFTSTRDTAVSASSAEAVISGISKDGGLFVPKELPSLDYKKMLELDYTARADTVLRAFFDFDTDGIADGAYASFDDGEPAPVIKLDDKLFVLELWHGRACASKDIALSVLPKILASAKKSAGDNTKTLMLVATSGDTGKAAIEGFKDVPGTEVIVFYPTGGVSELQKLSLSAQDGDNVCAVGVSGSLDEVRKAVKSALTGGELIAALKEKAVTLSSAGSYNVGSLVPQIAYYFSAYCDLVDSGEIKAGEKIDFSVPTNFGDILAGYYAYKMGLPVNKIICASDKNSVLADFIETGVYDANDEPNKTESVLVSGNYERFLFETCGRDAEVVRNRLNELNKTGRYKVTPKEIEEIRTVFACGYADKDDCADAVEEMFDEYGYLAGPRTAAAYAVAAERGFPRPTVVLSTVSPFKSAPEILKALGEKTKGAVAKETLEELSEISATEVPERLIELFGKEKRFTDIIEKEGVAAFIRNRFGV
ncbi:MAG: threonine synthase [Clostridiales bacterium]|nr:threonine synthase [Clostridiales bacterium]